MADRNTPSTFTFEEWRVEFNELAGDTGDISTLSGFTATDIVGAINENKTTIATKTTAAFAISMAVALG